jgi:hypothetical protein
MRSSGPSVVRSQLGVERITALAWWRDRNGTATPHRACSRPLCHRVWLVVPPLCLVYDDSIVTDTEVMQIDSNQPACSCIRSEVEGELVDFIADNKVFCKRGL